VALPARTSPLQIFLSSPLILNILVGDVFHNLFDGIAIGSAFRACGALGWVVSASVIVHELPQEISDFSILVKSGLPIPWALVANFCSSLSSILGVIIALVIGDTADAAGINNSLGLMLGFSAGILLYISVGLLSEVARCRSRVNSIGAWLVLIVGVIIIGVLKLWHVHCESCGAAGAGDHAGHDH